MVATTRTTLIATCQNGATPAAMRTGMITGENSGMNEKTVVAGLPGSGAATVSAMIHAATSTRITGIATLDTSSWRDTIEPAAANSSAYIR